MASNPNLCVDIFSQMANMMANFNSAIRTGGESFSHADGFEPTSTTTNSPDGLSFEENLNQSAQMFFIGAMIVFLIYNQLSSVMLNRTTTKGRPAGNPSNNNGGGGSVF